MSQDRDEPAEQSRGLMVTDPPGCEGGGCGVAGMAGGEASGVAPAPTRTEAI